MNNPESIPKSFASAIKSMFADGILLRFRAEDRPLKNGIGKVDWIFGGLFTQFLREGRIDIDSNQPTYVPISWGTHTFHCLLLPEEGKDITTLLTPLLAIPAKHWITLAEDWETPLGNIFEKNLITEKRLWILNS